MSKTNNRKPPDEGVFIFRASIRLRNGRKLTAQQCGLKAFKIRIRPNNDNKK